MLGFLPGKISCIHSLVGETDEAMLQSVLRRLGALRHHADALANVLLHPELLVIMRDKQRFTFRTANCFKETGTVESRRSASKAAKDGRKVVHGRENESKSIGKHGDR